MDAIKAFFFRYGTPFTAGLFLVSAVSGVALFLGWQPGAFHEMHEILSLVLIVPVAVHLWRNWKPLAAYLKRQPMAVALALSLAAGGVYAYQGLSRSSGGNPAMLLARAAQSAPISALAPVLALDEAAAAKRLADAGIASVQPGESLAAVAARTGRNPFELLAALTKPSP